MIDRQKDPAEQPELPAVPLALIGLLLLLAAALAILFLAAAQLIQTP